MESKDGTVNLSFVDECGEVPSIRRSENSDLEKAAEDANANGKQKVAKERPNWSNKTHFLMSCIQTSVGLGNVWRFPFTAFENGGGAFIIPYVIVLFLIGKPLYYLEMFLGQFTSKSSVKVWEVNPGFRGVGVGQTISSISVITYYSSLIALTLYYFFASFSSVLPWSQCLPEWGSECVDSLAKSNGSDATEHILKGVSSSELYFLNTVLNQTLDISHGIGYPSWRLTLCLLGTWVIVFLIIVRGVKSSGKASYFLAMFPYVVLLTLLVRSVTLEGASKGIIYFLKPQWNELLNPKMWFAATTQCFFSLSLGSGTIMMFSSYNHFDHKFYRDALIVTSLDTCTSLISGITIFGILGNLAHNLGVEDIRSVIKSGTGLAFISYPDAIAKFEFVPQVFAILFFFMLFTLGIGSVVALQNCFVTILCDQFPSLRYGRVAAGTSVFCFLVGLMYITPGGQWMLTLVDNFGGTLLIFVLGIFEIVGIMYFYGLEDICLDLEFATGRYVTFYWRICWLVISPLLMTIVFVYSTVTMEPLTYGGLDYPTEYLVAGWSIFLIGMFQLPLWASWTMANKSRTYGWSAIADTFKPSKYWGPQNPQLRVEWIKFKEEAKQRRRIAANAANHNPVIRKLYTIFGQYK